MENTETEPKEKRYIRSSGWFMISGLATGHAIFHWLLQSSVVVFPEIQNTFHLSGIGIGIILAVQQIVSGLVVLPGGIVVDVLQRHWGLFLASCIAGFSFGTLLMGISPVFYLLLIGMAMVSISHSIWHLPASASLSYHFPKNRGLALSFHGVGGSIGDVIGPMVTGALLLLMSWRGILSLYGALPLVFAYLIFRSFRNISGIAQTTKPSHRFEVTKNLLKNRVLWGIILVKGLRGMSLVALLTVLPLYLASDLNFSPPARGFHIGLLIAAGIVTKPLAGLLSDRLGRKQVLIPGLIWSCAASLMLIVTDQGVMLTLAIILLGLFLYPDQPIITATILEMVDRNVASTALGLTSSASFLLSSFSPLVVGALYELIGIEAALYYVAALFALAAFILVLIPLASSRANRDGS